MSEETIDHSASIAKATQFFASIDRSKATQSLAGDAGILRADKDGLVTVILAQEEVDGPLQKELDDQKKNLLDICGLGVAFVKNETDRTKDPNTPYNTVLWQDVFNHLPLMSASKFSRETFQQHLKGTEIALKFIEVIFEAVVTEGASLAAFGTFLQGLGNSIKVGVDSGKKTFSVGAITIVLETMKVGGKIELIPKLKGYFIDFSQQQQHWYSNCASHTEFDMSFDYRTAVSIFNHRALENQEVLAKFNDLIHKSQIADIETSDTYFNGTYKKK